MWTEDCTLALLTLIFRQIAKGCDNIPIWYGLVWLKDMAKAHGQWIWLGIAKGECGNWPSQPWILAVGYAKSYKPLNLLVIIHGHGMA